MKIVGGVCLLLASEEINIENAININFLFYLYSLSLNSCWSRHDLKHCWHATNFFVLDFIQKRDMVYGFESEMSVNQKYMKKLLLWCINKMCFVAFLEIMCLWMELMMICKWIFKWKWKLKLLLLYLGMVIVWMKRNGIFMFKCFFLSLGCGMMIE